MKSKSLEDALAELEAKKAQTAEYLAKHAPEIEAATVKRNALHAKLAALPQKERRKVLAVAGLKHISAAPPPIEPIRSSSTQPRTHAALPAIDWRYWRHMPEIRQWEACALSLNINPDNMQHHAEVWMAGPGSVPIFTDASFPSRAIRNVFDRRLNQLGVSLFSSGYFTTVNNLVMGGRHLATVDPREFAAWALHVEFDDMPPELVAIAETATTVPVVMPAQTAVTAAPVEAVGASDDVEPKSNLPWWQVAYDIQDMAQNIGAKLYSEKKRTSNAAIAKEIEKRINDIERSKGRDRTAPNHDTIRGLLTHRPWRPE